VNLPSFILPHPSESRAGGFALSTALLALPALVAGNARAGGVLLALSVVATAVFLERRTHARAGVRELAVRPLGLVSSVPPRRSGNPAPCARWELVERDGRRSLSMRWS